MIKRSKSVRILLGTCLLIIYSQMRPSRSHTLALLILDRPSFWFLFLRYRSSIVIWLYFALILKVDCQSVFCWILGDNAALDLESFLIMLKQQTVRPRIAGGWVLCCMALTAGPCLHRLTVNVRRRSPCCCCLDNGGVGHAQRQKGWVGSCPADFYKGSVGGRRFRLSELCYAINRFQQKFLIQFQL